MNNINITIYKTKTGKAPFNEWEGELDNKTQAIVANRLDRIRLGNFGDCTTIKSGEGVKELRIDFGPGHRIYFGIQGSTIVILLIGGEKKTQTRDIEKAKKYWHDCRENLL